MFEKVEWIKLGPCFSMNKIIRRRSGPRSHWPRDEHAFRAKLFRANRSLLRGHVRQRRSNWPWNLPSLIKQHEAMKRDFIVADTFFQFRNMSLLVEAPFFVNFYFRWLSFFDLEVWRLFSPFSLFFRWSFLYQVDGHDFALFTPPIPKGPGEARSISSCAKKRAGMRLTKNFESEISSLQFLIDRVFDPVHS